MKRLAIIGSGDLGRLIAYHASTCGFEIVGFFNDFEPEGVDAFGLKILGGLEKIEIRYSEGMFDFLMCGIGYKHMNLRASVFTKFSSKIPFANIIHPSSYVDPSVQLGKGIFVLPGCVLDHKVHIGNNVLLNTGCIVAHDSVVKDNCFISPGVSIAGFTVVEEKCILGIGTIVIDNINITNSVQTGAGTVVTKNLTKQGLYVGSPARFIK